MSPCRNIVAFVVLPFFLALWSVAGLANPWPELIQKKPRSLGGGEHDAAVVVGVEDYVYLPDVPGATQNSKDWYRYFVSIRNVPDNRVILLENSEATPTKIRDAIIDAGSNVGRSGTLWFVFIGHGAPSRDGKDGLLIGCDAHADITDFYNHTTPRSQVFDLMRAAGCDERVVVLDTCFSGMDSNGKQLVQGQFTVPVDLVEVEGLTVVTAGLASDIAGPLPGVNRPAFSYLALGALLGWGDHDGDGSVTASELAKYAVDTLMVLDRGRRQRPQFRGEDLGLVDRLATAPMAPRIDVIRMWIRTKKKGKGDSEKTEEETTGSAETSGVVELFEVVSPVRVHGLREIPRLEFEQSQVVPPSGWQQAFSRVWRRTPVAQESLVHLRTQTSSSPGCLELLSLDLTRGLSCFRETVRTLSVFQWDDQSLVSPEILDLAAAAIAGLARAEAYQDDLRNVLRFMDAFHMGTRASAFSVPDFSKAIEFIRQIPADKLLPRTMMRMAEWYWEAGRADSAEEVLVVLRRHRFSTGQEDLAARVFLLSAELALDRDDPDAALEHLSELRGYPLQPWSSAGLALLVRTFLAREGAWSEAINALAALLSVADREDDGQRSQVRWIRHQVASVVSQQILEERKSGDPTKWVSTEWLDDRIDRLPGPADAWADALWGFLKWDDVALSNLLRVVIDRQPSSEGLLRFCASMACACGVSAEGISCPDELSRPYPLWTGEDCVGVSEACSKALRPGGDFLLMNPEHEARAGRLAAAVLDALVMWADDGCRGCLEFEEEDCGSRAARYATELSERYPESELLCEALSIAAKVASEESVDTEEVERFLRNLMRRPECQECSHYLAAEALLAFHLRRWEETHGYVIETSDRDQLDALVAGPQDELTPQEQRFLHDCGHLLEILDSRKCVDACARIRIYGGERYASKKAFTDFGDRDAAYLLMRIARDHGMQQLEKVSTAVDGWSSRTVFLNDVLRHARYLMEHGPSHEREAAASLVAGHSLELGALSGDPCNKQALWGESIRALIRAGRPADATNLWLRLARETYFGRGGDSDICWDWELVCPVVSASLCTGDVERVGTILEAVFALADGDPDAEHVAMRGLRTAADIIGVVLMPEIGGKLLEIFWSERNWRSSGGRHFSPCEYPEVSQGPSGSAQHLMEWMATMGQEERPQRSELRMRLLSLLREGTAESADLLQAAMDLVALGLPAGEWERHRDLVDVGRVILTMLGEEERECLHGLVLTDLVEEILAEIESDPAVVRKKAARGSLASVERITRSILHKAEGDDLQSEVGPILVCALEGMGRQDDADKLRTELDLGKRWKPRNQSSRVLVGGKIDRQAVEKYLRMRLSIMFNCFNEVSKRNPGVSGKILLQLTIDLHGRVKVKVLKDTVGDPSVARCVVGNILRWRFPKPEGKPMRLKVPLVFRQASILDVEPAPPPAIPLSFCLTHHRLRGPETHGGVTGRRLTEADWVFLMYCVPETDPILEKAQDYIGDSELPDQAKEMLRIRYQQGDRALYAVESDWHGAPVGDVIP